MIDFTHHFPLNSPHYSSTLLITSQIPSDLLHSTQISSDLLHSTQISSDILHSTQISSIPLRYPPIHSLLLKSPQFPSSSPHKSQLSLIHQTSNLISFLLGSSFLFLIILLFE
ncbi:hypothetical protein TVAG_154330 [Trichomonas vaginalis G3]|uniref:Uncharacterized protein n=1 Tax=Trichomonas vaginalis (strain ATCC PRA-98 / G3) TaxID=412133 RepID=A2E439_TRIV3|nr:hypothetical protein TVAGG3_0703470 [Trichomonas vaginalis G3]EAY12582.1 hypothetical protein TVAG_154330 [Trichomonas vaginalis G3]KAI5509401.1 hypothetical protein TVAGG3_0703470 [Trichomonas vaginalis G3]|eukprot:XP_001324805.1 hypothetical protein [Trichomonas vaginalis G3]